MFRFFHVRYCGIAGCILLLGIIVWNASCRDRQLNPELDGVPQYVRKFFHSATNEFLATELLEWGKRLFANEQVPSGMLPREFWPEFLRSKTSQFSDPSWISIVNDNQGKKRMITIEYAGGFGLTGIAVLPSEDTPKSTGRPEFVRWTNGVYIYYSP